MVPVSNKIRGVPVTSTDAENTTCTLIALPVATLYEPFAVVEVTFETVGEEPITIALLAPSDVAAPGATNVNVADVP